MSDGRKSCLGVFFLLLALALAVLGVFSGGIGSLVNAFGGDAALDLRVGAILGIGAFVFFFSISLYLFIKVRDWAWIPMILSTLYAVLPDIILGPEDDILLLVLGGVVSALLAWRRDKSGKRKAEQVAADLLER